MTKMTTSGSEFGALSEVQLDFLRLVSAAAIANPFSDEREQLDKKLLDFFTAKSSEPVAKSIALETQRIVTQAGVGLSAADPSLPTKIKQMLSDAALFAVFHKFMDEFDSFIQQQQESPGRNLPMTFGHEIASELKRFGFDEQTEHLISIFFQMRRAFFFISKFVTGEARCVQELRVRLWRSLFTHDLRFYLEKMHDRLESFSILLLGETGVGKSLAAAAIGRCAYIPFNLKTSSFAASFLDIYVPANISEFSQTLLESELFGHKKGSFTGALESYEGLLGRTHVNGVLFLDEIGELSLPLQVKLLRVLQERQYSPVGSHEQKRFSGRLVSATNANIFEKIGSGEFRSDLFYRLASDVIEIPSLRKRLSESEGESLEIATRVLSRMVENPSPDLVRSCLKNVMRQVPKDYDWPGNVRELEQYLRGSILHGSSWSQSVQNRASNSGNAEVDLVTAWNAVRWSADEMLGAYVRNAYQQMGTYEKVAQRLGLDWRTVKKWAQEQES